MKHAILSLAAAIVFLSGCSKSETPEEQVQPIKDADGNVYHEVKIGTQTWLVENLRTTKFRNGDPIPNVTDYAQWENSTTAARCNFNNDEINVAGSGRLYNWYAVTDPRNICPPGYHIPSKAEWDLLKNYLGGETVAGSKLKSRNTSHWDDTTGNTNETGFTAIGAGMRTTNNGPSADFIHQRVLGVFWSNQAVENPTNNYSAWYFHLQYNMPNGSASFTPKNHGLSVRCIKD